MDVITIKDGQNTLILQPKEVRALQLLAEGHTTKEVAAQMKISVRSVEHYRCNVTKRAGAKTFLELIIILYKKGIIK